MKQVIHMREHIEILGKKVKDRVTGMAGIATSVSFDLFGCIQVVVNPGTDKEGKLREGVWFDIARLEVMDNKPVMTVPDYDYGPAAKGIKGPSEKPSNYRY